MKFLGSLFVTLFALSLITPAVSSEYSLEEYGCVSIDETVTYFISVDPNTVIVNFVTDTDDKESHVYLASPTQPTVLKLNFNADGCLFSDVELSFEAYDLETTGI